MAGLFKSKTREVTPKAAVMADPYGQTREALTGWLTSQVGKPGPSYAGDVMAPMSEFERMAEEPLRKYAAAPIPSIWQEGREEISKTLKGDYDPASSPYYQAVKAEAAKNLGETQKEIASRAAGGGRYYTGARLGEQATAATDVGIALNKMLGGIAEKERERRFQAAPVAQEFAQYEEREPIRKTAALREYGALPRELQQAYLDTIRSEWEKSTRDWPLDIAGLASGVQKAPLYGQVGYAQEPSVFSQIYDPIAGGVGEAFGSAMGTYTGKGASNFLFPPKTKKVKV